MAQHWEAAGEAERAVGAWQEAGDRAKERSAMTEVERHYHRALAVLATLPDTPARASQELQLQMMLYTITAVTHGWGSEEGELVKKRVREVSVRAGDTRQLAFSLIMAWSVPFARGELRAAHAWAEESLTLARTDGSSFALAWSHLAVGQTRFALGELPAAREHAEAVLQFYREEDHRDWPIDPGAVAQGVLAYVLAHQGFAGRAHREIEKLAARGGQLKLGSQRCLAHVCAAAACAQLRQPSGVAAHAQQVLTLASENDLPEYLVSGHIFRGWALALQGQSEDGIAELRPSLAVYPTFGNRSAVGEYLGWMAEAQMLAGQVSDGLATIEEALTAVPEERIFIPELLRLRGELRAAAGADVATVEASFEEAIALACELGTKLIELRATTNLARFRARHGRGDEARAGLAPLYAWFTEGFDAPDLVDAKSVLEELG